MDRSDPAYRGQRDYGRLLLSVYDPLVLGVTARWVWRCPSPRLLDLYRRHAGRPHLDVGPGTGYFLRRAGLPPGAPVTLLDPNPAVLRFAAGRLPDLRVTAVEADVLRPLPVAGPFASAALSLVLHCLPGPPERKAAAVANVAATLASDGILFGSTVLGERAADHTGPARLVLRAYNRRGAFDNRGDDAAWLRAALAASFRDAEVTTVGSIALFVARGPR